MMAKRRARADKAFSPPDIRLSDWIFLPGGCTEISTPASRRLSEVKIKSAEPPPNIWVKVCLKLSRIASKVALKRDFTSSSMSFMVFRRRLLASSKSSFCPFKKSRRCLTSSNWAIASTLTGPKALIERSRPCRFWRVCSTLSRGLAWPLATSSVIW